MMKKISLITKKGEKIKKKIDLIYDNYSLPWLLFFRKYKEDSYAHKFIVSRYNQENIDSEFKGSIIVMINQHKNNGLIDRLRGCLSSYSIARKNGKRFYINWTEPFELTKYLEPSKYDWRIDASKIVYNKKIFPAFIRSNRKFSKLKRAFYRQIFTHWLNSKKEIHVYSNLIVNEREFSELFNELFTPSPYLKEELKKYQREEPYWSFSFRFMQLLGDFKDETGEILNEDGREILIHKNIEKLQSLLYELPDGYKAFVASDSRIFLERAQKLDERIFTIPGEIAHPDYYDNDTNNESAILKMFIDFYMIMGAQKVYRFKTGKMHTSQFPRIASIIAKKEFCPIDF